MSEIVLHVEIPGLASMISPVIIKDGILCYEVCVIQHVPVLPGGVRMEDSGT